MARLLCKNGRIFDGEKLFDADIAIDGDRITGIAPHIDEEAAYTFDAKGMTVLPGLVDGHVHMKGISSDAFGIPADAITLPFGVTAAVDASGIQGSRAMLDTFGVNNLVFVCAAIQDDTASFESADSMRKIYGDKVIGIKVFFDASSPHVRSIAPLRQIVGYAEKNGLKIMVHSTNSPVPMRELLDTLRAGDILTHAYHGGKNNVSEDDFTCIFRAKERGIIIDAGLAGHVHMDFGVFRAAIEKGALPDIISTDITRASAYKRGGRYGLPLCMSIARHLGMCEEDIFRAVTTAPARAFGKEHEWGTLKVGGKADLAVLSYGNESFDLTDAADDRVTSNLGYRNKLTVLNGDIVYKD